MTKAIKETSKSELIIDRQVIIDTIKESGKYQEDNATIKKWEEDESGDMFIADITSQNIAFRGVLGGNLKRESYGINGFKSGDRYFGYFDDNKRSKHGIYEWKPETRGDQIRREYYYGLWKKDMRQDHGVYLWLNESKNIKPFSNFEQANFDAFVGMMKNDRFSYGAYISKQGEEYFVYHGHFDGDGKRCDDHAFFYCAAEDVLMYGKTVNNQFLSGYVAKFNDEGEMQSIVKGELGLDKDAIPMKNVVKNSDIPEKELQKNIDIMTVFRNVILKQDYFGMIYEKFGQITNFMDNKMATTSALESSTDFPEIMQIVIKHQQITLHKDIINIVYHK